MKTGMKTGDEIFIHGYIGQEQIDSITLNDDDGYYMGNIIPHKVEEALKNKRTLLDEVLEVIDGSIADVEALKTGKDGAIGVEKKEGMLLEAKAIRLCVEQMKNRRI